MISLMVVFDMATRVYRIYTKDTLLLNMLVFSSTKVSTIEASPIDLLIGDKLLTQELERIHLSGCQILKHFGILLSSASVQSYNCIFLGFIFLSETFS